MDRARYRHLALGPSRTTLTVRYLGPGRLTDCSQASGLGIAAADKYVGTVTHFALAEHLDVIERGTKFTVVGAVENLLDRDPPPIAGSYLSVNSQAPYDLLGRTIRIGPLPPVAARGLCGARSRATVGA